MKKKKTPWFFQHRGDYKNYREFLKGRMGAWKEAAKRDKNMYWAMLLRVLKPHLQKELDRAIKAKI